VPAERRGHGGEHRLFAAGLRLGVDRLVQVPLDLVELLLGGVLDDEPVDDVE
jgi:hypothetical protein